MQDSALVCGHPNRTRLTLQLEQRALCASRASLSLSGEALDMRRGVSKSRSKCLSITYFMNLGYMQETCSFVPTDLRWQNLFWLWGSDPGAASHVRECPRARRPVWIPQPTSLKTFCDWAVAGTMARDLPTAARDAAVFAVETS